MFPYFLHLPLRRGSAQGGLGEARGALRSQGGEGGESWAAASGDCRLRLHFLRQVGPFELAGTHKAAEALKHGERKVIPFFLKSAPASIFDNYDFPPPSVRNQMMQWSAVYIGYFAIIQHTIYRTIRKEIHRASHINAGLCFFTRKNHRLSLSDCPGHLPESLFSSRLQ
jgi:hypothetical protein